MPGLATRSLEVPQPVGEPVMLDDKYGALSQYSEISRRLDGVVPAHLVAITARNANSKSISTDELTSIAQEMHAADRLLRTGSSVPVIYRLHCADKIGITPEDGTYGFRQVDISQDTHTAVETAKQYSLWGGRLTEGKEVITEGEDLTMYRPLSFLTSGYSKDVKRFVTHRPEWMRTPNSHVVVGHSAVDAFLKAQAEKELMGEDGALQPNAVITSWAMLAAAGLRRLGYTPTIGKRGDIVHRASIAELSDVVASSMGHRANIGRLYVGEDNLFVRRLGGVEFDLRTDAQEVGKRATELLFSDENRVNSYRGLLYGDRTGVEASMTETAGRFMEKVGITKYGYES